MRRPFSASAAIAIALLAAARADGQGPSAPRLVEAVEFENNRRVPDESLRLWVQTREGAPYSPEQIRRDLRTVLAQGFFADARVFAREGPRGGVVLVFYLEEYPTILGIDYPGLKSVSESDVLEEWRKRSIALSKDSQLDPLKAQRAAAAIRDLLAARGRPDARVVWKLEPVARASVILHFEVSEGERVRVAEIVFEGNQAFSDAELRRQMKLVKEAGLVSGLADRDIYDKEKLQYDLERVRFFYMDHGFLGARFGEPVATEAGEVGGGVPLVGGKDRGLKITVPVDEGKVYRVGKVRIEGATVYPEEVIRAVVGLREGEVVRASQVQKGVYEDIKRLYGERGFIECEPAFSPTLHDDSSDPSRGVADITIAISQGRSYAVRRIEFKGNTYTRDKVLRRELLLTEGEPYNQRYWELSLLRLNQLGVFDEIKETDADIRTDERTGNVDVDLRVQEKGRQQIQFTGGVSGTSGSTAGVQYSTNNFLGLGETLSFSAAAGDRVKDFSAAFSEPYVLDRPVSAGFQLFHRDASFVAGDAGELFRQTSSGGAVSLSAPLSYFFSTAPLARFGRLGLTYSYRNTEIVDPSRGNPASFPLVSYSESGIEQSTLAPSLTYSTLDSALDPRRGQSLALSLALSGGSLGGDVDAFQPNLEYKFFRPVGFSRPGSPPKGVFGMRVLAGHVRAFSPEPADSLSLVGGTPVYSRYFLGGEDTIRGYDANSLSPATQVLRRATTRDVYAVDERGRRLRAARPGAEHRRSVASGFLRRYGLDDALVEDELYTQIGADTQLVANFEYRRPLFGPVSVAAFFDAGTAFNVAPLADQVARSEYALSLLSPPEGVVLNPRGRVATQAEIDAARTPESSGELPPGFRRAYALGDLQYTNVYRLSEASRGLSSNFRSSLGAELRVQVPVINVPLRIIFAYNPNARTELEPGRLERESRFKIGFSIGRTF